MIRKRWAVAALAAAIGLVLGAASMVLAGATVTTAQANSLAVIKTLAMEGDPSTPSASFVDVPGVARNATSTATSNLFVAEFSAVPDCDTTGTGTFAICEVRISVEDNAGSSIGFMNPDGSGTLFITTTEEFGLRHIEKSISGLPPATYTFQVQFRVIGDPGTFGLEDIHFTLTRYV